MKKLSMRQAILDAIDETDEQTGRFPNQLLKWGKYIEKEIGSALGYSIKSQLFTLTGCYLTLPDDCYHVIGVFPGDHSTEFNTQYRDMRIPLLYNIDDVSDEIQYVWCPENTTWISPLFWEEIGNELHMINEYEDMIMTLVYHHIDIDVKGYWYVNESHIAAIKKYMIYMMAKKYGWKIFKSDKLLRSSHFEMIKELKQDYSHAIRNARAEDGKESEFERQQY
jgi:hypothetical protein